MLVGRSLGQTVVMYKNGCLARVAVFIWYNIDSARRHYADKQNKKAQALL